MPRHLPPLRVDPQLHERVWGGQRFEAPGKTIGEVWIVWEGDRVVGGPYARRTLGELAAELGPALVGTARHQSTFPLLIKLLDTREWLSIQVHPDDADAVALEGAGYVGKTEAWHVLDAEPGAQLIAGLRPGADRQALASALGANTILDLVAYRSVRAGDTIYIPAGTIHALGPGLLIYEVQQSSDITYRVFDWNRPPSAGRPLHLTQTLAVANPAAEVSVLPAPGGPGPAHDELVASPYFVLERLAASTGWSVELDTGGASFHALTVVEGRADVVVGDVREELARFETMLVPAATGAYRVESPGAFQALLSRLP